MLFVVVVVLVMLFFLPFFAPTKSGKNKENDTDNLTSLPDIFYIWRKGRERFLADFFFIIDVSHSRNEGFFYFYFIFLLAFFYSKSHAAYRSFAKFIPGSKTLVPKKRRLKNTFSGNFDNSSSSIRQTSLFLRQSIGRQAGRQAGTHPTRQPFMATLLLF